VRSTALLQRLHERGVLRVAASYAVIAWLLLQIADVTFEPLGVPRWVMIALITAAVLGFPVAIMLAWHFELGDRGLERDTAADAAARPVVHGLRRYADVAIIGVLLATVAALTEAVTRSGSMRYGTAYFGRLVRELLGRLPSRAMNGTLALFNILTFFVYLLGFASVLNGATGIGMGLWIAALFALTRNIAHEVGPHGIRCNAIAPGLIWSRFVEKFDADFRPLVEATPLRRASGRTPMRSRSTMSPADIVTA